VSTFLFPAQITADAAVRGRTGPRTGSWPAPRPSSVVGRIGSAGHVPAHPARDHRPSRLEEV